MSIYSTVESGTQMYRSRFSLGHTKIFDMDFGTLVPAMMKFVLPGDVWKCGANLLIRYQPTLAPPLTRAWARMRYFFVPLRLIEPNTEKIITGSQNGKLIETSLPTFEGAFDKVTNAANYDVVKYSFYDYMGIPCVNYSQIKNDKCIPAAYWLKSYCRSWFDFYRDENFEAANDFDSWVNNICLPLGGKRYLLPVCLHKDYFTSSLPWQLKGTAPTIEISGGYADFTNCVSASGPGSINVSYSPSSGPGNGLSLDGSIANSYLVSSLNKNTIQGVGTINMDDLRTMAAQTRVFERLARTGSRYTEYIRANFPTYPRDDSLQRAQYLGGFKQPIVTTEVVQTGSNDSTDVGTLRGHGISSGGNMIKPFVAQEFGIIMGLLDIMPELQYTQGIDREFTYRSRFDFFNPSFQHLSEQEVRNGELFISPNDGKNDEVFGYQAIYNELRTSRDIVVGDMRDSLSYWTQAVNFSSRPNLNSNFLSAANYQANFKQPFSVQSGAMPIIVQCGNILDVYRPMVKYGTPGLVDHL